MAAKKMKMFTAERVALLLVAVIFLACACFLFWDRTAAEETLPEPIANIDSVTGTISTDSLKTRRGKKTSKKKKATKKNTTKDKGPRDHLREPIPQH